jgi:hypothetical protein
MSCALSTPHFHCNRNGPPHAGFFYGDYLPARQLERVNPSAFSMPVYDGRVKASQNLETDIAKM